MPKIQRETQKIFCNSAESDQLAVFGSMATGTPDYSNNIEELQNNEAFDLGWDAATLEDKAPFMEEMNGMQYGITKQLAYNFQEGIPEYDAGTTYYIGSIVKVLEENKPVLYTSLTDENLGNNPITDATNWERLSFGGGGLEIGDIGIAPLGIDETKGKRRYLNGQLIIQEQYVQFANKVKSAVALYPSLACTESEWQTTATMTVGGQVGKFVVDDDAGTIRLPKIIMPIQGLTDLSKLGEIVEAGLPNITGSLYDNPVASAVGAFKRTVSGVARAQANNSSGASYFGTTTFDASLSNPTYGNSDTVQQEQIQYPYFIQVATGAETEDNIINEIELNNPYSFGDSKYSPVALNNLSWLKSEGQWNSKAVYPAYYDWALTNFNNGVEGFALSTGEYTDYDVVINPAEETFRLPLLDGSEDLPSTKYDTLTLSASGTTYIAPANGWFYIAKVATANGQYIDMNQFSNSGEYIYTVSLQAIDIVSLRLNIYVKKGDNVQIRYTVDGTNEYFKFVYAQGNGSLYFYVGETVQNANLINAGRIEEKIADLIPDNASLIAGYGMPDLASEIEIFISVNAVISIPSDGFFKPQVGPAGGINIQPLNITTSSVVYSWTRGSAGYQEPWFPIPKGEYKIARADDAISIWFYPLKGAN